MKIKKTIAAIAAAAMVFTSVPMVAFAEDCTNHTWTYEASTTAGKHKQKCTADNEDCSAKEWSEVDHAAASPDAYEVGTDGHWKKCACGAKVGSTLAPHSYTVKGTGDDAGYMKCVCGAKQACTHPTWTNGTSSGKKKCTTCDYETDCEHASVTWSGSGTHTATCNACGKATTAHVADMKTVSISSSQHQSKCAETGCTISELATSHGTLTYTDKGAKHEEACPDCDYKATVDHNVSSWSAVADTDTHKGDCTDCSAEITKAHSFAWNDTAGKVVCECGAENGEHEHAFTTWAAGTGANSAKHVKVCDCGKEGPTMHTASETLSGEYTTSATQHWKECTVAGCDVTGTKEDHVYDDDDDVDCNTCGYERNLGGGGGENPGNTTPGTTPGTDEPGADKPGTDKPGTDKPGTDKPGTDKPGTDKPGTDKPGTTTPGTTTPGSSTGSSSSSSSGSSSASGSTTVSTAAQIRNSTKSNIIVNVAETKVTTAMVNAFTNNKKANTLTLNYGAKVKVVIAKGDVKDAADIAKLDFSVTGKNFISTKTIKNNKTLSKAEKVVQIKFVQKGKLDGVSKVTVKGRVGARYAGQKATVYEYVNGKLVKVGTAKVGATGLVSFKIDHFGKYIIAVDK